MRIGVDLMGGDLPPQAIFEAVLQISKEVNSSITIAPVATRELFSHLKKQYSSFLEEYEPKCPAAIEYVEAEETIEMDEPPLLAMRRKKNSSMAIGIRHLKEKSFDAFISAGNTGALMGLAMHHLPKLPGIERPALLVVLPSGKKGVVVLDVGANVTCKKKHLLDFAKMGVIYAQCVNKIRVPKLGLLNIGVEEEKGTQELKETYHVLSDYFQKKPNQFLGNIEGREVFQGKVDVLVTDGFTGNVFLKTCEGVSLYFFDYLLDYFSKQGKREISSLVKHLRDRFNYSEHPGALLAGIDGIVVKCHGSSNASALMNGIRGAILLVKSNLTKKMKDKLLDPTFSMYNLV